MEFAIAGTRDASWIKDNGENELAEHADQTGQESAECVHSSADFYAQSGKPIDVAVGWQARDRSLRSEAQRTQCAIDPARHTGIAHKPVAPDRRSDRWRMWLPVTSTFS